MRFAISPEGAVERLALHLGLAPLPVLDVLLPLVQVRAIMAGVKLGVFESLADRPLSAAQLAGELGLDRATLVLLLRVLCSTRYLEHRRRGFALTSAGHQLLRGSAQTYARYVEFNYEQWTLVEGLERALKTGRGADFHDELSPDAAGWAAYQGAMLELSRPLAGLLSKEVPVPRGARHLLDLGGSHGLLGAAICRVHPPLRSTVIELPAALPHARQLACEQGIGHLVTHVAGDLRSCALEPEPDVVLLGNVIHHLRAEERRILLSRVLRALRPNGSLAVWELEMPLETAHRELAGDALALYFRLTSSAEALSVAELRDVLQEVGFVGVRSRRFVRARGFCLTVARRA